MPEKQMFSVELIESTLRSKIEETKRELENTPKEDKRMRIALKGEIRGLEFAWDLCNHSRVGGRS